MAKVITMFAKFGIIILKDSEFSRYRVLSETLNSIWSMASSVKYYLGKANFR